MDKLKIIIFKINERHFALPTSSVKEITESDKKLKSVFYDRGGALKGLINYEGAMISVLDTSFLLDLKGEEGEPLILICKEKGMEEPVGITATSTEGMETIDAGKLKHSLDEEASYSAGFLREGSGEDERVVTLIDLKKFLDFTGNKIKGFEAAS